MADVILETKDFKVFLDFMNSKDAIYYMYFQGYSNISTHCFANDARYVGELIRSGVAELKYTCSRPIRISFDSEMRESLVESCETSLSRSRSKGKTVSITGPSVVLGEDQYTVDSQYLDNPVSPLIRDWSEQERIQEMTISRSEFERVVNILLKEKIQLARLHFLEKSGRLEVSTTTEQSTSWIFRLSTSDVKFSGEEYDEYFHAVENPEPPHVIDSNYNVDALMNVIRAMKYHYSREDNFSLSLLQNERLFFESGNKEGTLIVRGILKKAVK